MNNEDRNEVVCLYYNISRDEFADIIRLDHSVRKAICFEQGINPHIVRTMVDYSRYPEAQFIMECLLEHGENISELKVVDFGCLVADYGIFFGRHGARVSIYDEEEVVKFSTYRFQRENIPVNIHYIPSNYEDVFRDQDLAIFGEVLEHMDDPLLPIKSCISEGVKYIFSSCYPFGGREYYKLSGHMESAQRLQSECIRLLANHCDAFPADGKAVLWKRRDRTGPSV